jgi:Xaa-Pro aminopeptidase
MIAEIQKRLQEANLPGWLFYDHHHRDPIAYRVLGFEAPRTPTRRWFYLIPSGADPVALVHRIEATMLDALPGEKRMYASWQTLKSELQGMLGSMGKVAMQYSSLCEIPYVSLVDGGMIDLIRSFGVEVVSSADLVQYFDAVWSQAQLEMHLEAGRRVDAVRTEAFKRISAATRGNKRLDEYEVQQYILDQFSKNGLCTDHGPIVAVNANASNPHYEPTREAKSPIRAGDFVLIDLWAKLERPGAVYYDVTWTGYCGEQPPDEMRRIFEIVRGARDAAVTFVKSRVAARQPVAGFEVDDAARGHIRAHGLGDHFVHRTGHSIGVDVHGNGANMDNLESHDTRQLIPGTCFSIEPGVYLEKFGIRSEVNVYVGESEAMVTGEQQRELLRL